MANARTTGRCWDPACSVPLREFVHSWFEVANGAMTAPQPAAGLQRGLGVLARLKQQQYDLLLENMCSSGQIVAGNQPAGLPAIHIGGGTTYA